MSKDMTMDWKDAMEIVEFYSEKTKSLPIKNPAVLDQEELDAVSAIHLECKKEIKAFFDRRDEENRKWHEEFIARPLLGVKTVEKKDGSITWKIIAQVLFIGFLVVDLSQEVPESMGVLIFIGTFWGGLYFLGWAADRLTGVHRERWTKEGFSEWLTIIGSLVFIFWFALALEKSDINWPRHHRGGGPICEQDNRGYYCEDY